MIISEMETLKTKHQVFIAMALANINNHSGYVRYDYPIESIANLCEDDLLKIRGCGKKTIADMSKELVKYGVSFKTHNKTNNNIISALKAMQSCNDCCLGKVCDKLTTLDETSICILLKI